MWTSSCDKYPGSLTLDNARPFFYLLCAASSLPRRLSMPTIYRTLEDLEGRTTALIIIPLPQSEGFYTNLSNESIIIHDTFCTRDLAVVVADGRVETLFGTQPDTIREIDVALAQM
jgi:hypothetical protein